MNSAQSSSANVVNFPPMGTTANFRPRTGTMDEWNAAYVRVENYLRAHRIHNRLHQSRLIQQILERAAHRHEAEPGRSPTVLAAEETETLMDLWFADMLDQRGQPHERIAVDGRLALLPLEPPKTDVPAAPPAVVLSGAAGSPLQAEAPNAKPRLPKTRHAEREHSQRLMRARAMGTALSQLRSGPKRPNSFV